MHEFESPRTHKTLDGKVVSQIVFWLPAGCNGCAAPALTWDSADDESSGHHKGPNAVRGPLRASRHPVAVGDAADDQRVLAQDYAGELRLYGSLPALCLQLDRIEPL